MRTIKKENPIKEFTFTEEKYQAVERTVKVDTTKLPKFLFRVGARGFEVFEFDCLDTNIKGEPIAFYRGKEHSVVDINISLNKESVLEDWDLDRNHLKTDLNKLIEKNADDIESKARFIRDQESQMKKLKEVRTSIKSGVEENPKDKA